MSRSNSTTSVSPFPWIRHQIDANGGYFRSSKKCNADDDDDDNNQGDHGDPCRCHDNCPHWKMQWKRNTFTMILAVFCWPWQCVELNINVHPSSCAADDQSVILLRNQLPIDVEALN